MIIFDAAAVARDCETDRSALQCEAEDDAAFTAGPAGDKNQCGTLASAGRKSEIRRLPESLRYTNPLAGPARQLALTYGQPPSLSGRHAALAGMVATVLK
jgi:hypothetical protein